MSQNELPPKPQGNIYYAELEPESLVDGWCYGYITQHPCDLHPKGCPYGDGYVVAPDGSYAGLAWATDCPWIIKKTRDGSKSGEPDKFFGVYEVLFKRPVSTPADFAFNLEYILPSLKAKYENWKASLG